LEWMIEARFRSDAHSLTESMASSTLPEKTRGPVCSVLDVYARKVGVDD